MPHGPRLSLELRSLARQGIHDGRLPLKFSLVSDAGYGWDAICSVCEQPIEHHRVRYRETDVRDGGGSLMFHLVCHRCMAA
jgi:hypothetical protein